VQLSLGTKIQFFVIGMVAVLALLLGFFFPLRQQQQLQASFERITQSLAVTVALGAEIGLKNGDFSAMQNAIDFARQDAELAYVAVINDAGAVEASFPTDLRPGAFPTENVVSRRARVTTTIFDGEVIVGRSTEALQATISSVRRTAALMCMLAILLGAGAAVWLARYIAQPVRALRDAAERVGEGDLEQQVNIDANDEVGQLADAFNAMVADIRTYLHEARAAARAKSEFLATMSHEIRTPLNGVTGMAYLLQNTPLNAEQKHYVDVIQTSSDNLLAIINDILDFSKAESGRLELEAKPFNVVDTIERVLDLTAPNVVDKDVELVLRVGETVPSTVVGDVTRVRQVVLNLLSNAVKFTHEGEVVVTIEAEPQGDEAWHIRLSVRDTGIGISADKQDQLFKKFTQADASMTREYGGTGLGLSISQQLCELMGGRIEVESREGHGSTFYATFRVGRVAEADDYSEPDPALQGCRVLIVEDNATSRDTLATYAKRWGMSVDTADTLKAAFTRLKAQPPVDAIVVDRGVVVQAEDALQNLVDQAAGLPIVVLAEVGHAASLPQGDAAVTTVYKPVKYHAYRRALRSALSEPTEASPDPPEGAIDIAATRFALRVLVAEDNAINRTVMREMLERLGCDVQTVADGEAALQAVEQEPFDLVLMDIQMPRMGGLEATRRLTARYAVAERPYIAALTAYTMAGKRRDKADAAGVDDVITKPVPLEALVALLRRVQQSGSSDGMPAVPTDEAKASPPTAETIRRVLQTRIGAENPALANALLTRFLQSAAEARQALRTAQQTRDLAAIEQVAHSFRTSSATVGAEATAQAAQALEQLCRRKAPWDEIAAQIETLTNTTRQAEQTIQAMVAEKES
jgi:signal transduction histidine kinase/CheY-like chemotaxis protein